MNKRPVIAVIGSGGENEPAVSNARDLGRSIAECGWVLITGGRDAGVMRAANGAARNAGGLTIGILPNRNAKVSPDVDVEIVTDTGHARNNIIVLSADVVVACGVDGAGTASETALAIKNGKPVVLLGAGDDAVTFFSRIGGGRIHLASSAADVITFIKQILGL